MIYKKFKQNSKPFRFQYLVFIVACYAIAVMCYRSMKSAEQNKSSPEASEISETPELDISSLPDETIETNRMAYV